MTCELNPEPCENCELLYCPDQIIAICEYYTVAKEGITQKESLLKVEKEKLEAFISEHKEILAL